MDFAREAIKQYRDPESTEAIDENDVAYMYIIGYMAGRGNDDWCVRQAALYTAHHFMDLGYNLASRHMRVSRQDAFRLTLE